MAADLLHQLLYLEDISSAQGNESAVVPNRGLRQFGRTVVK